MSGSEKAPQVKLSSGVKSGESQTSFEERYFSLPDTQPIVHIVEFENSSDQELREVLKGDGYDVVSYQFTQANPVEDLAQPPDLILLNLSAEQSGGLASCRNFRSAYPQCSICLIHAGLSEWEESIALELGADAVVGRPTEVRRILAQIRALLRRNRQNTPSSFKLLKGSRSVNVNNISISLTDAEFELLSVLAKEPGTVVSRDIDLRIARIRQKLGDNPHRPQFIRTVRGEGYMLISHNS